MDPERSERTSFTETRSGGYGTTGSIQGKAGFYETPTSDIFVEDSMINFLSAKNGENEKTGGLGVFLGVFVPCVLSIFGVIIFERLGWIIGQSGLILSILILIMGYTMVTLTTLSLSAIATNGKVKGGGAYYMISRSLGPSLGGGVGVIFYFANIFAGGTYMSGFVSALIEVPFLDGYNSYPFQVLYGTIVLFLVMLVCIVGADAFAKTSFLIFVFLWVSLLGCLGSIWFTSDSTVEGFTWWSTETFSDNITPHFDGESFHSVFAVFFPAVTGIMAGANMSGDLKNPGRAIPLGTLSAIGVTFCFYVVLVFSLAFTVTSEALIDNLFILQSICFWPPLFLVGVWLSTLSSALGVLIGGARIAQALAKDNLIPGIGWLSHGSGKNNEPRIAVLFSYLLIQLTVFLGTNVNLLASMTTMFFLLSYGFVNLACFTVTIAGAPNFRPSWKFFNSWTALAGAVICFFGMFFVQPFLSCIAVVLVLVLMAVIAWRAPPNDWGDVTQALMYHQVRKYLLRLDIRKEHKKYWRPQVLLFVADPVKQIDLMGFGNNLKKGGLYMIASVVKGSPQDLGDRVRPYTLKWLEFLSLAKIKGFPEVTVASTIRHGMEALLLAAGLGQMKPNTILFGFYRRKDVHPIAEIPADDHRPKFTQKVKDIFEDYSVSDDDSSFSAEDYVAVLKLAVFYQKNICIGRYFSSLNKRAIVDYRGDTPTYFNRKKRFTIDMWPILLPNRFDYTFSSELLMMMGHITKQTDIWQQYSKLRVKGIARNDSEVDFVRGFLENLISSVRIKSRVEVITLNSLNIPLYNEAVESHGLQVDGSNFESLPNEIRFPILNQILKSQSEFTCSMFLPLPPLPEEDAENYIAQLELLTDGLPPVMLVHGSQSVVCSEL